jgi:L-threonylcarbamoyladenylate synthase
MAQELLDAAGVPVAAPSANPSGRITATRAEHVLAGLGEAVDAVLEGGRCDVGLESTILRTSPLALLREGGVPAERIETVLGQTLPKDTTPGKVQAPGQLSSHYAPGVAVELDANSAVPDAVLIGFGAVGGDFSLSPTGDLREAAASLFDVLHQADALAEARGLKRIAVATIPEEGLGRAINDRLRRAAAPR